MGYIIFISVFNVTRNWQEAGFLFQRLLLLLLYYYYYYYIIIIIIITIIIIIIIIIKMYLKGVPFFNGRCTQISTFPVKS